MHSAAPQYNQPEPLWGNVSLVVQSRFQWERASIAAALARPMSWIKLETNKFYSSANQWVLALRLSAVEETRWCPLGFQGEDDSQDHVERGAEQILQIDDAADCAGSLDLTCMKCDKRVSVAKHLHNLSPFSLHSMIEVSAEAWHATLYLITPWQHLPRLGILLYILSRLGSICRGLAFYSNILSRSICRGLACFSILSRLGSICQGLAFYSISYHALAVSA